MLCSGCIACHANYDQKSLAKDCLIKAKSFDSYTYLPIHGGGNEAADFLSFCNLRTWPSKDFHLNFVAFFTSYHKTVV